MTDGLGDLWALFQPWLFYDPLIHMNLPLCLGLNKFPGATSPKNNTDAKNPLIFYGVYSNPFPRRECQFAQAVSGFSVYFPKED